MRRAVLIALLLLLAALNSDSRPLFAKIETPVDGAFWKGPDPALSGTFQSGIKVQNLTGSQGQVSVDFRNDGGTLVYSTPVTPISANGSVEFYLPSIAGLGTGRYAATVNSDVLVSAVATTTDYTDGIADSYNSSAGATTVGVPYVYRGLNSWYTRITVQNTSASSTNVTFTVNAAPGSSGSASFTIYNLAGYGAATLDTETDSRFNSLGSSFRGSAVITSSGGAAIAVSALEIRMSPYHIMTAIKGTDSTDSDTKVGVPSLYKLFNGWRSGIQILNPSGSPVTVTVTFNGDNGSGSYALPPQSIGAQSSFEYYLPGVASVPNGFKGSAVITSTGAVNAAVLHTNYDRDVANSYSGISNASATGNISFPSLYKSFGVGPWNSGIKILNLGTSTATVTLTFQTDGGGASYTKSGIIIPGGGSYEFYLPGTALNGGAMLPDGFIGSARAVAAEGGSKIVGTVLHTNYYRGVANAYTGINY